MFYKDRPACAKEVSFPKVVTKDEGGKAVFVSGPSPQQEFHGYNLRKNHVKASQEVTFCTNLHIDFLQSAR